MGCFLSSAHWSRTALIVYLDVSTSSSNCFIRSGCASVGSLVTLALSWSKVSWHALVHMKGVSFFVSSLRGKASFENSVMNCQ